MRKQIIYTLLSVLPLVSAGQAWKKLHERATVVDTHNDVLSTATMEGLDISHDLSGKTHSDLARFKTGGVDVQVFSIFCDERYGKGTAFAHALREIDSLKAIERRNSHRMMMAYNSKELIAAVTSDRLAAMIGVEGGHMIEDRMDYLDSLARLGMKYMTLTWNNSTSWASSAKDETRGTVPNAQKGLNEFGKQVVRRMNELGVLVDLSHVGEQTFWDAMAVTRRPVIVSHSCVYALSGHFRNLKDDQIRAVGKNGGVIHLNFYSEFLDSSYGRKQAAFLLKHKAEQDSLTALGKPFYEVGEILWKKYPAEVEDMRPPLSLLIDHVDYIVRLIGVKHVGLGSDFDGINSSPKELDDVTRMPLITKALMERGYSRKDILKILGGNFLRILRAND